MMRTVYQELLRMETLKGTIGAKSFQNLGPVPPPGCKSLQRDSLGASHYKSHKWPLVEICLSSEG